MVSVLHWLSYVGGLAGFLFVTLSLASGLLWLAELIEEHSRHAKTVGIRAIYSIITLHVILYFTDSLPFLPTLFSIFCHLVYLQNFSSSWPYISLTSLKFIASCLLVVADHFTWFFHFAQRAQEHKKFRGPKYRYGASSAVSRDGEETFMDIAAFFGICVWFVPLFLFLSLSANDNALPQLHPSAVPSPATGGLGQTVDLASPAIDTAMNRGSYRPKVSLVKSLFNPVINFLPRLGSKKRYGQDPEGIIAPRTPVRGSPLHTPVDMPMPDNYFPWGSGAGTGSNGETSSSTPSSASHVSRPGSAAGSASLGRVGGAGLGLGRPGGKTPPPPRRVQSEMMTAGLNPRGVATRNGVPAVPDSLMVEGNVSHGKGGRSMTEEPESIRRTGLGAAGRQTPMRPDSPSMSLGPERGIPLGGVEIIETKGQAQPKRKAD